MVDEFQVNTVDEIDPNLKSQIVLFLLKYNRDQSETSILSFFHKNNLLDSSNKIQFIIKALLLAIFYYQNSDCYKKVIFHLIKNFEILYSDNNISYTRFLNYQIINFTNKYNINPFLYNIHTLNNLFKPQKELQLPCIEIIKNDDVDALQQDIVLNSNLTTNKYNILSFSGKYENFQELYLIEFAAYFGSLKSFKFLYLNKARYSDNINNFAIAGGNAEIIHICESISSNYESCLSISIQFHRNEIYEWLICNKNVQPDIECLISSIRYHNMTLFEDIIYFLLESNKEKDILDNINKIIENSIYAFEPLMMQHICDNINIPKDSNFQTEAFLAIKISSLKCLEILLKYFDYSKILNSPSILFLASVKYSCISCVELITDKFTNLIDYNYQDEKGLTPLHYAVILKDSKKINYLLTKCMKNNIDLNIKDKSSMTPFFYAVKEGNERIVEMFLNTKKVKGNDHDIIFNNYFLIMEFD